MRQGWLRLWVGPLGLRLRVRLLVLGLLVGLLVGLVLGWLVGLSGWPSRGDIPGHERGRRQDGWSTLPGTWRMGGGQNGEERFATASYQLPSLYVQAPTETKHILAVSVGVRMLGRQTSQPTLPRA